MRHPTLPKLSRIRYRVLAGVTALMMMPRIAAGTSLSDAMSLGSRFTGSSEYRAGNLPDSLLVSVRVIGAVPKAGVHYIPKRTDLMTLLAYAGGILPNSEGYLVIKREVGREFKNYRLEFSTLTESEDNSVPTIQEGDIVYVPFYKPAIHPDTAQTLSFIATLLSIAISSTVLITQLK